MKILRKPFLLALLFLSFLFITLGMTGIVSESKPVSVCALDESTAVIKETNGETVNYYSSFSEAINNVGDYSTLTLLQDAVIESDFRYKKITLDLNGKKLTSPSKITISYSTIRLIDSIGSGEMNVNNTTAYTSCNVTIESAKVANNTYINNNTSLNVTGGYINTLQANSSATISGGEISKLLIYSASYITLSGGKIHNIEFLYTIVDPDYSIIIK